MLRAHEATPLRIVPGGNLFGSNPDAKFAHEAMSRLIWSRT
jgi:hypothetical protein